jgi:uncharacterized protein YjgD (DUF1641 family)
MSETITQQSPSESAIAAASGKQDVLDQLLRPEVQESLSALVDSLPKLTEMVAFLTKAYDTAQSIATDRVLIQDMSEGLQEIVKPIQEKAKGCLSAAIEANERAQADETTIGLFGLLKMLKDPQMQKMFRFTQAYLDIMSQRQSGKTE